MLTISNILCGLSRKRVVGCICVAAAFLLPAPSGAGRVTSMADTGPGSLREAIIEANDDGVPTRIRFDPELFPAIIALKSRLPALVDEGDAIEARGGAVVLDGSDVPDAAGALAIGLRIRASNVTIRGLTLQNFAFDGIYVGPSQLDQGVAITQVTIQDNILINNLNGIRISGNRGPDNWVSAAVKGNVLMNNRDDGITVDGCLNNGLGHNDVEVVIDGNRVTGSMGETSGGTLTGDGIRVLGGRGDGSDNQVSADIVNNWTVNNVDDGIVVAGAGGGPASRNFVVARVFNNVVRNNGASSSTNGNGIVIRGGSRAGADPAGADNTLHFDVKGNHSLENKDTGILISGGVGENHFLHGAAVANWAKLNDLDGIRLTAGQGTDNHISHAGLVGNQLIENLRDGLHINGGSGRFALVENIFFHKNRALRNDRFGFLASGGAGDDNAVSIQGIRNNRSNGNRRDGLFIGGGVSGTGEAPIVRNRCQRNGEDGIDVDATGFFLEKNRSIGNAEDGINAWGNDDDGGNLAIGNAGCNTPGCY